MDATAQAPSAYMRKLLTMLVLIEPIYRFQDHWIVLAKLTQVRY